jgi:hypothetical protein
VPAKGEAVLTVVAPRADLLWRRSTGSIMLLFVCTRCASRPELSDVKSGPTVLKPPETQLNIRVKGIHSQLM